MVTEREREKAEREPGSRFRRFRGSDGIRMKPRWWSCNRICEADGTWLQLIESGNRVCRL